VNFGRGKSKPIKWKGEKFIPMVMQVVGRDDDGKPRDLRLLYPEESVSAENEPEFIVGFVKPKVLEPTPEKSN